jgi:hypothetical protein
MSKWSAQRSVVRSVGWLGPRSSHALKGQEDNSERKKDELGRSEKPSIEISFLAKLEWQEWKKRLLLLES